MGVGQRFCGASGPKPGTAEGNPLPGSSMISNTSDALEAPACGKRRLVTGTLYRIVKSACGIAAPTSGAVPPVQVSVTSPVCSAYPSPRRAGVTVTFVLHVGFPGDGTTTIPGSATEIGTALPL